MGQKAPYYQLEKLLEKIAMNSIKLIPIIILIVSSSCQQDDYEYSNDTRPTYSPGSVLVTAKKHYPIDSVFKFINSFNHRVHSINRPTHVSGISLDSLNYVLDNLQSKPYINEHSAYLNKRVTEMKNKMALAIRLSNMNNTSFQTDWLKTKNELKLSVDTAASISGFMIEFIVPVGEEEEWVHKFSEYDIVDHATLNWLFYLN
jgi:hypothetical protein